MDNPIDNLYLKIEELQQQNDELRKALEEMCEYHEKQATWDKGDNGYYKAKRTLSNNPKL